MHLLETASPGQERSQTDLLVVLDSDAVLAERRMVSAEASARMSASAFLSVGREARI